VPQNKYLIVKNDDAQHSLSPTQKQQLLDILRTVATYRQNQNKSVGDLFFVLNMKDIYARAALDQYICAINFDDTAMTNAGVAEALAVATEIKITATLNIETRLPD
jgi:hypothetical protein